MQHSLTSFRASGGSVTCLSRAYLPGSFYGDPVRRFTSRSRHTATDSDRSKWASHALAASNGSGILERIRQLPKRMDSSYDNYIASQDNHKPTNKLSSPASPTSTSGQVPQTIIAHKAAMKKLFPDGWNPPKKLSREAMEGLRTLHDHDPETFTTTVLANRFKISPEAVRRILKSRWRPDTNRLTQIAQKEARARRAMIARQKFGVESAEANEDIPTMYLDEESDKILSRDGHSSDTPDPTGSEGSRTSLFADRPSAPRLYASAVRRRDYIRRE